MKTVTTGFTLAWNAVGCMTNFILRGVTSAKVLVTIPESAQTKHAVESVGLLVMKRVPAPMPTNLTSLLSILVITVQNLDSLHVITLPSRLSVHLIEYSRISCVPLYLTTQKTCEDKAIDQKLNLFLALEL